MTVENSAEGQPDAASHQGKSGGRKQKTRERRNQQVQEVDAAIAALSQTLASIKKKERDCRTLDSHPTGFYGEIDKLAKGKSLLAVTDLVVQQINDIVRDAKSVISDDPYLDRVREFVPAGDNPVYPDVLLVARTVKQCIQRNEHGFSAATAPITRRIREAQTIAAAIELALEDEGNDPQVPRELLDERFEGEINEDWFEEFDDGNEYFDLTRLDEMDLKAYLTSVENDGDGTKAKQENGIEAEEEEQEEEEE
jgi:hypothetical protein